MQPEIIIPSEDTREAPTAYLSYEGVPLCGLNTHPTCITALPMVYTQLKRPRYLLLLHDDQVMPVTSMLALKCQGPVMWKWR